MPSKGKKKKKINIVEIIRKNIWVVIGFTILFFIIITNQIHQPYPDEFGNILGGWKIINGIFPYVGFFRHHNPGGYFAGASIVLFSGQSFVWFRLILGVFYLLWFIFFYRFIKARYGKYEKGIIQFFYVFIIVGATYFWGQMLLADVLAAYLITVAYIVVFFNAINNIKLDRKDIWIISIFTGLALLTTFALIYACALLYLYAFYLYARDHGVKDIKKLLKVILIFAAPYIVFLLYLLATKSLVDFYQQGILYNTDIYVTLPDDVNTKNPVRVAIVIFWEFVKNYKATLNMVNDLNYANPIAHATALSSVVLIVYLLFNRKFTLSLFVFFFLVYCTSRGNPYSVRETDYHSIQYIYLSVFNGLAVLVYMWRDLSTKKVHDAKKIFYYFFLLYLGIYMFFLGLLFFNKWFEKTYLKYMGRQALIYDRPPIANILNELIDEDEFYFIGPYDYEDQLYMKGKPASRYTTVLTGMDESPRIQNEILEDLRTNRPKIIVFNTEFIFFSGNTPAGGFVEDYLTEEYVNLAGLGLAEEGYTVKHKWLDEYDFERHIFIDKERKDEVLQLLIDKGYVIPPNETSY